MMDFAKYHQGYEKHTNTSSFSMLIYVIGSFILVAFLIGSVVFLLALNHKQSNRLIQKRTEKIYLRRLNKTMIRAEILTEKLAPSSVSNINCQFFDPNDIGCGIGGECFYTKIDSNYIRACKCNEVS